MTHSHLSRKILSKLLRESFDNSPDTLIGYLHRLDLITVAQDEGLEDLAQEMLQDNKEKAHATPS